MSSRFAKKNTSQKSRDITTKTSKTYFFQCEGETEQTYVKVLCGKYGINAKYGLKSKLNLEIPEVKKNIKELITEGYAIDEVIFIYDTENSSAQVRLFNSIRELRLSPRLFITASCIEVWFIMHFKVLFHNQFVDADKRLHELKQQLPDYVKNPTADYIREKFIPETDTAIRNSSLVYQAAIRDDVFSTYSQIHNLVTLLKEDQA